MPVQSQLDDSDLVAPSHIAYPIRGVGPPRQISGKGKVIQIAGIDEVGEIFVVAELIEARGLEGVQLR